MSLARDAESCCIPLVMLREMRRSSSTLRQNDHFPYGYVRACGSKVRSFGPDFYPRAKARGFYLASRCEAGGWTVLRSAGWVQVFPVGQEAGAEGVSGHMSPLGQQ